MACVHHIDDLDLEYWVYTLGLLRFHEMLLDGLKNKAKQKFGMLTNLIYCSFVLIRKVYSPRYCVKINYLITIV